MNTNVQQLVAKAMMTLLLGWAASGEAAVRYVALDGSGTNGLSWATAYKDVQTAIDDAAVADGDEIRVKQGWYTIKAPIVVSKAVKILGGYSGVITARDPMVFKTTIDGAGNAPHGLVVTTDSQIDGLTITGGRASYQEEIDGGGMVITNCRATVTNCTFAQNFCQRWGGGIALSAAHGTVIADCTFTDNVAGSQGGGIHNKDSDITINGCLFIHNEANATADGSGGGIMNDQGVPSIIGCTFTKNVALYGAGIYNAYTDALIESCTFADCGVVTACGGGIYNIGGSPTISKCLFQHNGVTNWGGAVMNRSSSATIIDCIMWENSAMAHGGAVYIGPTEDLLVAYPQFINCTMYGNTATFGGALYSRSAAATLWNCILWGNRAYISNPGIYNNTLAWNATTVANYCDIEGDNTYPGAKNLCVDPLFEDPERGNFQLQAGSPCVDAGSHVPSIETLDYEGNQRVVDGDQNGSAVVDLGALEFQSRSQVNRAYRGQIMQTIAYEGPTDTSATYLFTMLLETDDTVYRIEFRAPNSGNIYRIPNDSQTSSGGVSTSHQIRNGRHVWQYRAALDSPAALAGYGNGTYRITFYYRGASQHETQMVFLKPGYNTPITQPTQKPVILSPSVSRAMGSPVTAAWDACTDTSVNTIRLTIMNSATGEEIITDALDAALVESNAYALPEGLYEIKCAFANLQEGTSSDGTPFTCGKAIVVSQQFEVSYSAVYRFWSPNSGCHFYTIYESEKDWLIDNYPHIWIFEGPMYNACATPYHAGLLPVYRFWSGQTHFYTISAQEKDNLLKEQPEALTYEGIAFYAYPEGAQPVGCVPVYRFWSASNNTYFYTADEVERARIATEYAHIFTDEGIAFYAYP